MLISRIHSGIETETSWTIIVTYESPQPTLQQCILFNSTTEYYSKFHNINKTEYDWWNTQSHTFEVRKWNSVLAFSYYAISHTYSIMIANNMHRNKIYLLVKTARKLHPLYTNKYIYYSYRPDTFLTWTYTQQYWNCFISKLRRCDLIAYVLFTVTARNMNW